MSGGIDDVQAVIFPETGSSRRLDGDTTLLLLLHEISRGRAIMHLAGLVDFAGKFEDTLGGGGLASVNVGEDTYVPVLG